MVCDVGVKKVFFVFVVLMVKYLNVYGIDMLVKEELIVFECIVEEICEIIGVDCLIF